MNHCHKCNYDWETRPIKGRDMTLLPRECPACKRYDWSIPNKEVIKNDNLQTVPSSIKGDVEANDLPRVD